jgi:hypothetical protein
MNGDIYQIMLENIIGYAKYNSVKGGNLIISRWGWQTASCFQTPSEECSGAANVCYLENGYRAVLKWR